MTNIMRYDPFREALSLRHAMDQLFEQSFVQPSWNGGRTNTLSAPVDVYENEQGYQVRILLPGAKPEDVELTVQQNTLTVKGQFKPSVKPDAKVHWLAQEIGEGSFERIITFPKPIDADKVETIFEQGVLTLSLPIHETSRPKRITLTGKQPGSESFTVEAGTKANGR